MGISEDQQAFWDACTVEQRAFDPLLHRLEWETSIDTPHRRVNYFCIKPDGYQRPNVAGLVKRMISHALHFVYPEDLGTGKDYWELDERAVDARQAFIAFLRERREERLKTRKHAKNQRETGEYGELLLFCILEAFYHVPQIVSKLSLKTAQKMPVFGADALHAGVSASGQLELWVGESKLFKDVESAVDDAFESVRTMAQEAKTDRELLLYRSKPNARPSEGFERVKNKVTTGIDTVDYRIVFPIFIGFEDTVYDDLTKRDFDEPVKQVEAAIQARYGTWNSVVETAKGKISPTARFVVIFLPFPDMDDFRKQVDEALHA